MAEIVQAAEDLPPYNQTQQIYCISATVNAAGKLEATTENLEAAIRKCLDTLLPQLPPKGTWETVWGPAVYKSQPDEETAPENAWYAACNKDERLLVVPIAGTALFSTTAWWEDFKVNEVVNFEEWTKSWTVDDVPRPNITWRKTGTTLVSYGTCYFVHNILNYPSPKTGKAPGTRLAKFLQDFQHQNTDYTIVFTGHSLGGAVSPTLALGLLQSKILKNNRVETMPSAGASPGNAAFKDLFTNQLPARGPYNVVAYNTLDLVPQAWSLITSEQRKLDNIPEIWREARAEVQNIINGAVLYARLKSGFGTSYIALPGQQFTGRNIKAGLDRDEFRAEAKYQHIGAYWDKVQVTEFVKLYEDLIENHPGIKIAEEPTDDWVEPDLEKITAELEAKERSEA